MMKKRLLSAFLAVMMIFTMLPAALAVDDASDIDKDTGDAASLTIDGTVTTYNDMTAAFQGWAENGGILQLLQDGDLTAKVTLKKECTLDLNSKTLSTNVSNALYVDGGTLTIEDSSEGENGVYESTTSGQVYINSGNVTLENGTLRGAGGSTGIVSVRRNNNSFIMNDGIVECTGTMVKGELDKTIGYAIVGCGTQKAKPNQVTINGGTVTSVGNAIYTHQASVNYTIGGNAKVGRIALSGLSNSYRIQMILKDSALVDELTFADKGSLGFFNLTVEDTVRFKSDISDALANTVYQCFVTENGTYQVLQLTEDNAAAAIINGAETTYYGTLAGALQAVGTGETVKLLKDYTSAYPVKVNNAAYGMTLDLNGYNITNTNTVSTANALELAFGGQDEYPPVKVINSSDTAATISAAIPVVARASQGAMEVVIGENVTLDSTADQRQMKLEGSACVDVSGKTDSEIDALGDLWKTADNKLFGDFSYAAKFAKGDITLVKDYTGLSGLTARNDCVVDFNGHTYNVQSNAQSVLDILTDGVSVTLKNGTLTSGTPHTGIITNGTNSNINLTLQDFTLSVPNGRGIYFPSSGSVTIENSIINAKHFGVQACAGSLTVSGNKTAITATGDPQAKIENDGPIDDGAAVSIVNRNGYKGLDKIQILGGAFAASDTSKAVKAYSFNNTNKTEDAWDNAADTISISGGYFTSNPFAYKADGKYVVASDKDGYKYMITDTEPSKAEVIVTDNTAVEVKNDNLTQEDKTAIENKTNVDGVAESVADSKDAIVSAAGVDASIAENKSKLIEVDVQVNVAVEDVQKTEGEDAAVSSITFTANPVATVKVDGVATGETVSVSNSMLNKKQPITVKLPLPAGFTPKQIKHISADGSVEYFINKTEGSMRGASSFEVVDGCAVFTITHFSKFEMTGTVTYVAPSSSGGSSGGSSSKTTYKVSTSSVANGGVNVTPSSPAKGDKVTITLSPNKGYKLDKLTVTDASGKTVSVTKTSDTVYTFTMPASQVTVGVTYVKADETEQPSDSKTFSDVSSSDWFADAVKYVSDKGMMNGTGNGKFSPADSTTRGMLMTVIARYAGQDTTGSNPWYQKGMEWAKANGVSDGTAPNANITREQLVTMLYRYAQSSGKDVSIGEDTNILSYTDATTVSEYAIPAMQWACGAGIVNGSNGKLNPQNNATRAEVAAILMRYCENIK